MKFVKTVIASSILAVSSAAQAGIVFSFDEVGGDVVMNSSGQLDTSQLTSFSLSSWGGVGIETNTSPESDIMGDTTMGGVDTAFAFSAGTDFSPWIGDMFTQSIFGWTTSGTTQFTTYVMSPDRTPGIGLSSLDLVNDLWTPDVSWSKAGTFSSFGMTEGTYTINDSITNEFISIQIGPVSAVPEPSTYALMFGGLGLVGFMAARRRKQA